MENIHTVTLIKAFSKIVVYLRNDIIQYFFTIVNLIHGIIRLTALSLFTFSQRARSRIKKVDLAYKVISLRIHSDPL